MTTMKRTAEAALEVVIEAYLLGYDPKPSHRRLRRGANCSGSRPGTPLRGLGITESADALIRGDIGIEGW